MRLFQRPRYPELPWPLLGLAALMTSFGLAFVISSTMGVDGSWGGPARKQLMWWLLGIVGCVVCVHVPLTLWRALAVPGYLAALVVQAAMMVLAGTSLVPTIKGAHNWLALGPLRVQPSEFFKLATILLVARLLSHPQVDIRRLWWCLLVAGLGLFPALLLAREDLGSAMTFGPLVVGMLVLAGMPLRYLVLGLLLLVATAVVGIRALPEDSYQYKRLQAWQAPEEYALTEGYQTLRALRSIGSGQLTGKGYAAGDQYVLRLPEPHTDMVFAIIAEELGFLGAMCVPLLFVAFGWAGMYASVQSREPFGRYVIAGFTCLIVGQAAINLCVATGLMPVTGITLPFFSYGGSSLLVTWCGLGMCAAAGAARTRQMQRTVYV